MPICICTYVCTSVGISMHACKYRIRDAAAQQHKRQGKGKNQGKNKARGGKGRIGK